MLYRLKYLEILLCVVMSCTIIPAHALIDELSKEVIGLGLIACSAIGFISWKMTKDSCDKLMHQEKLKAMACQQRIENLERQLQSKQQNYEAEQQREQHQAQAYFSQKLHILNNYYSNLSNPIDQQAHHVENKYLLALIQSEHDYQDILNKAYLLDQEHVQTALLKILDFQKHIKTRYAQSIAQSQHQLADKKRDDILKDIEINTKQQELELLKHQQSQEAIKVDNAQKVEELKQQLLQEKTAAQRIKASAYQQLDIASIQKGFLEALNVSQSTSVNLIKAAMQEHQQENDIKKDLDVLARKIESIRLMIVYQSMLMLSELSSNKDFKESITSHAQEGLRIQINNDSVGKPQEALEQELMRNNNKYKNTVQSYATGNTE